MDLKEQLFWEQLDRLESIEEQIVFTYYPSDRKRLEHQWLEVRTAIFQSANEEYASLLIRYFTHYVEFWVKTYTNLQMIYEDCSNRADDPKIKGRWRLREEQVLKHIERVKESEPLIDNIKKSLEDS